MTLRRGFCNLTPGSLPKPDDAADQRRPIRELWLYVRRSGEARAGLERRFHSGFTLCKSRPLTPVRVLPDWRKVLQR